MFAEVKKFVRGFNDAHDRVSFLRSDGVINGEQEIEVYSQIYFDTVGAIANFWPTILAKGVPWVIWAERNISMPDLDWKIRLASSVLPGLTGYALAFGVAYLCSDSSRDHFTESKRMMRISDLASRG